MGNTSTPIAAGIGLLFGLAGGIAGALFIGAQSSPATRDSLSQPQDPALLRAIDELRQEVRSLHESLANRLTEPAREPALGSSEPDLDRLVAAIDKLATITNTSSAPSSTARRNAPALIVPDRPQNAALLRELQPVDYDVRSRQYRFFTYQQVLDQFGPPDEVHNDNSWFYAVPGTGGLTFRFFDGMLVNIF